MRYGEPADCKEKERDKRPTRIQCSFITRFRPSTGEGNMCRGSTRSSPGACSTHDIGFLLLFVLWCLLRLVPADEKQLGTRIGVRDPFLIEEVFEGGNLVLGREREPLRRPDAKDERNGGAAWF